MLTDVPLSVCVKTMFVNAGSLATSIVYDCVSLPLHENVGLNAGIDAVSAGLSSVGATGTAADTSNSRLVSCAAAPDAVPSISIG